MTYLYTFAHDFFSEEVAFVEEDDEWFQMKKLVVGDRREQLQALVHPVHLLVLGQDLLKQVQGCFA
jgi:hypothetical protein